MNIQHFATKAKAVDPNNMNIINAVRAALPYHIQDRIPEATIDNLQAVYDTILNNQNIRNEFMVALPALIGIQTMDAVTFNNPLAVYKRSPIRFGATDEEIYVNMAKGHAYDGWAGTDAMFKRYLSYVMANFHTVNFEMQYDVTIDYNTMRNAFMSEYGLRDMMQAKMMSLYASGEWDEYLVMKQLIDTGYEKRVLPAVKVDPVTDKTSAENLMVELQAFIGEAQFPNPANNVAGANSSSNASNMLFITTPQVNARIGVQALANAYNLSYVETKARTVIVDKFEHEEIVAVALDLRFFRCRDQFREISYDRNGSALYWNYHYTMFEQISPSLFYPMRVFTTDTVGVASLSGTGITDAVPGTTREIVVTPTGSAGAGYTPELYDYEITSTPSSHKTQMVPGTNQLIIGDDETAFPITVKVSYRPDTTISITVSVAKQAG